VARNFLEFCWRNISIMLRQFVLHAVKSYDMGPPALLPIREEGVLRIFIVLKNP